ncbi:chlorophyll A-B binding protein [Nitzschia inconspicua]|uniref:Chlorophyll A-B binding protein n=1 Tax=Nitzschia inconspicua TaxID=303405 RepID=A0A9K3LJN8_9STRA|nr:chlorophyll A-B binding protein [Nitzschia inconspicua]
MKLCASLLLVALGSAAAFAPSGKNVAQRTNTVELGLWGEPNPKDGESGDKSKALPFAPRPKLLDGTLAGDVGFDPFGFAGADTASLMYMREAELKHSRLAILAVVGWPLAELWDKPLADAAGLPTLLTKTGESPALLNGGLDKIPAAYWVAVIALAGIVELENMKVKEEKGKAYLPGMCNFDPLGLFPSDKAGQMAMMTKEIKHGRIAMMGILGFAIQEAVYNQPVVSETPFFFHPVF